MKQHSLLETLLLWTCVVPVWSPRNRRMAPVHMTSWSASWRCSIFDGIDRNILTWNEIYYFSDFIIFQMYGECYLLSIFIELPEKRFECVIYEIPAILSRPHCTLSKISSISVDLVFTGKLVMFWYLVESDQISIFPFALPSFSPLYCPPFINMI